VDREVGYCQGSAFIVGLLLMQVNVIFLICEPLKSLLECIICHGALLGIFITIFLRHFVTMDLSRAAIYSANQRRLTLCGSILSLSGRIHLFLRAKVGLQACILTNFLFQFYYTESPQSSNGTSQFV